MKDPLSASELRSHLAHYMGSQQVFHLPMQWKTVYTEGVRYFAQNAGNGAYWFLTILVTEPAIFKQAEDFAFIKLLKWRARKQRSRWMTEEAIRPCICAVSSSRIAQKVSGSSTSPIEQLCFRASTSLSF